MKCRIIDLDLADDYDTCGITLNYRHSHDMFNHVIGIVAMIELWDNEGTQCTGFEISASFEECQRFAFRLLEKIGESIKPNNPANQGS